MKLPSLDLLIALCIAATVLLALVAARAELYNRAPQYGGWIDADGDCMNTRHEVLQEESLAPVVLSEDGCKVVKGLWYDPYSALAFTDPKKLDVDHVVPLAEAHRSGADEWTNEERRAYANDLDNPGHLIAVQARENRRKGAKDPALWMPHNVAFHCAYIRTWVAIKAKYRLRMDDAEATTVALVMASC